MKAFFAAVIGKSGYEKWKVNEPGVFYFLFYVQSREIPKKPVAGVARKESKLVVLNKTCMAAILKALSTVITENRRNKVFTLIKQLKM